MDNNIEQLREDFEELLRKHEEVLKKNKELEEKVNKIDEFMKSHAHTRVDGSAQLRDHISLPTETFIEIGKAQISEKEEDGFNFFGISIGPDGSENFTTFTTNTQLSLYHYPDSTNSFFFGFRPPFVTGRGADISSGSTTMTLPDVTVESGSLAGTYLNVYSSAGVFQFTRTITSNTHNTITVSSSFPSDVVAARYTVFYPVYLGSADHPWRRVYTGEGSGEGIRFGYGPTAGGQNGMLYMDATGDLYWRNKSGTSTKLN